jgi:hypothetical protein
MLRLHYILYPTFNIRSTSFFPPWEPRRAETEYSFYALGVQLLRKRVVRNKLYRMRRKWMRRVLRMICSLYAKDKSKQILMTNSSLVVVVGVTWQGTFTYHSIYNSLLIVSIKKGAISKPNSMPPFITWFIGTEDSGILIISYM